MAISMIVATGMVLIAAIYAQHEIPRFTKNPRGVLATRGVLIVLGLAVGYVAADTLSTAGSPPVIMFLFGFGAVHVPAALILLLKRAAGAGKS
jgi:hypothetical protein